MTETMWTARSRRHDAPDTATALQALAELGSGPQRARLREEIIAAWLPIAHRMSRRYRTSGESPADLRQVAAVGLVKAVDGFDPARGYPFQSYAIPTISGELRRHVRDRVWSVHIPRVDQELRAQVRTVQSQLQSAGTQSPSEAQIAATAGLTLSEVRVGLRADGVHHTLSLEYATDTGAGHTVSETLGSVDPALGQAEARAVLRPLLAGLPEQEKTILFWVYFEHRTQREIAAHLQISQMQVSRILRRIHGHLRHELGAAVEPAPAADTPTRSVLR
ncbi:sigma-70 family RNA polymerase sigma factor [Streptomyces sp. NPDC006733]|uniref:sigma-70 family RNA polymerase sigma factor n=1 Tax=Streptomyces sp. NPDC006733 TaxID=3155460 RepID=UPI0033F48ED8